MKMKKRHTGKNKKPNLKKLRAEVCSGLKKCCIMMAYQNEY